MGLDQKLTGVNPAKVVKGILSWISMRRIIGQKLKNIALTIATLGN
jgi:hypothetical protein